MKAEELDKYVSSSTLLSIYEELERDILRYLAKRADVGAASLAVDTYQATIIKESKQAQAYINKLIGKAAADINAEAVIMFNFIASDKLEEVNGVIQGANLAALDTTNETIQAIVNQQLKLVQGTIANLTATTAKNASGQLYGILSTAASQVTSGAFSYDVAITNALKALGNSGITAIKYNGGATSSLYSGARRAILTSLNQTAQKVTDGAMDEYGIDLVEVNAHVGAREEHSHWQGKIYSRSGKNKKYPDLVAVTGYGSVTGLAGANCRHSYMPFIEGASKRAYDDETLEAMNSETVTYLGKDIPVDKALQQQRYLERQVRTWKNKEAIFKEVDLAGGANRTAAAAKVKTYQAQLAKFTKDTGLKRDYTRER